MYTMLLLNGFNIDLGSEFCSGLIVRCSRIRDLHHLGPLDDYPILVFGVGLDNAHRFWNIFPSGSWIFARM